MSGVGPRSNISSDIEMSRDREAMFNNDGEEGDTSSSFRRPSMQNDANGIAAHFENPELYRAAKAGNVTMFQQRLRDLELAHFVSAQMRSPRGDTVLHIAAELGHEELVRVILGRSDLLALIAYPNSVQNMPLHVAARAGNLSTVKILVSAAREAQHAMPSSSSASSTSANNVNAAGHDQEFPSLVKFLLSVVNIDHNTPLNLALSNRHEDVARFLFEQEPDATHYHNTERKSPLLMAAEAGSEQLFEIMVKKPVPSDWSAQVTMMYRTNVVRGAITAKNKRILDILLRDWPEVFTSNGQRESMPHPIFHAVQIGYVEGVRDILNKFRECSYFVSEYGSYFPINLAAKKGQVEIVQEFLTRCPDSRELCNDRGQNILHLAAKHGKAKVLIYILNNPDLEMLINERDFYGNTPLHLAVEHGHAKVVSILTWDSRVNLELMNDRKMTALDIADGVRAPSFHQRLTWQALRNAGVLRAVDLPTTTSFPNLQHHSTTSSPKPSNMDFYKDRINTLMLVSTLIVTITFAAGLISPGSDDEDSKPNPTMFHVFVITNTVALYGSITAVVALIWAQLGDRELIIASFKCALPALGLSLAMVSLSFMAGAYLVASNTSIWLANSVLVLASIGFLAFFLLFAPLYCPNRSLKRHRFARYIFYYPFCLLVKVTKSPDEDK